MRNRTCLAQHYGFTHEELDFIINYDIKYRMGKELNCTSNRTVGLNLLAGTQPVIMALARGMKEKPEPEFRKSIDEGRLLIVTPFDKSVKRVSAETAEKRNRFMIKLADEITVGYASKGGMLKRLIGEFGGKTFNRIQ
jgi:hypothetical protein